jgi:hypothetical protein
LQPPHAVVDHEAHDQLILPARLVHADLAVDDHLQAVAQLHRLPQGVAAEQHRAELRAGVLEGKIRMAAGLRAQVGDFAADPRGAEAALEELLHAAGELRHALHPPGIPEGGVGRFHAPDFFRP